MRDSHYTEAKQEDKPDKQPKTIFIRDGLEIDLSLDRDKRIYVVRSGEREIGKIEEHQGTWGFESVDLSGTWFDDALMLGLSRCCAYLSGRIVQDYTRRIEGKGGKVDCNDCGAKIVFRQNPESESWIPVERNKSSFLWVPYWDRYFHFNHGADCKTK
jgi:hypothetical protein